MPRRFGCGVRFARDRRDLSADRQRPPVHPPGALAAWEVCFAIIPTIERITTRRTQCRPNENVSDDRRLVDRPFSWTDFEPAFQCPRRVTIRPMEICAITQEEEDTVLLDLTSIREGSDWSGDAPIVTEFAPPHGRSSRRLRSVQRDCWATRGSDERRDCASRRRRTPTRARANQPESAGGRSRAQRCRWLATAGHLGTTRLWTTDLEQLSQRVCRSPGRNWTPKEWSRSQLADCPWRPTCGEWVKPTR